MRENPRPFRRALKRAAIVTVSALLPVIGLPVVAGATPQGLEIVKRVDNTRPLPGESFTYTIVASCSEEDCLDMRVTDAFPAELDGFAIQSVSMSPSPTSVPRTVVWSSTGTSAAPERIGDDTTLTVDLHEPTDAPVGTGLSSGQTFTILITLRVPDDFPPGQADPIVNTAEVSASNADTKRDDAQIVVEVAERIDVSVDKTWDRNRQTFEPGSGSTIELSARNTSNVEVDSLVLQEPKVAPDGASALDADNPFTITDFVGVDVSGVPPGCSAVRIDAYVLDEDEGTWSWVGGEPTEPAAAALPDGVSATDVGGIRITCTGRIRPGSAMSVDLDVAQRATHRNTDDSIAGVTSTVTNVASGSAVKGSTTATDEGTADYRVVPLVPTVEAAKNISDQRLVAGGSTTGRVAGTNGNTRVEELTLADLDFFSEEITFGGFTGPLTWPVGATGAVVTYHLLAGGTQGVPATQGVVPAAPSGPISGFEITWTGTIQPDETGGASFRIETSEDATDGERELDLLNTVTVTNAASNGLTATDVARAPLTILDPTIDLAFTKTMRPGGSVNPGETVIASLAANAQAVGDGTVIEQIVVTDAWDETCRNTWNAFDLSGLASTQVPADSTMRLEVQVGGTWHEVFTHGPQPEATTTALDRADLVDLLDDRSLALGDVTGVRVTFASTTAAGFPSDTTVTPNLVLAARSSLRDPACTAPTPDAEVQYTNVAQAEVDGETAGGKPLTDEGVDRDVATVIIPSTAPGPVDVDKAWNRDTVDSQAGATASTRLLWNVAEGYRSVVIADTAVDPAGSGHDIANSVFDAFDLTGVQAISASSEPYSTGWYLRYDSVTRVERFDGTSWVEVTPPVGGWMAGSAATNDRRFTGVDLVDVAGSTTGVRITLEETAADTAARIAATQPGPAFDPYAPEAGSGVGSGSVDRRFVLNWALRDVKRSTGEFVTADLTYNSRAGGQLERGVVDNTVRLTATPLSGGDTAEATEHDTITILDRDPLVRVEKTVTPDLGGGTDIFTPPTGSPDEKYADATWTITARNASVARASYVRVSDPAICTDTELAPCQDDATPTSATADPFDTSDGVDHLTNASAPNPFERFDATRLTIGASIAGQVDLDATRVWLLRYDEDERTYRTTSHSATAVNAMTPAQLADVVGFSVTFQSTDPTVSGGTITQANALTVRVESTLRRTYRSSGEDLVLRAGQTYNQANRVYAQSYDPVTSPGVVTGDVDDATTRLTGGIVNIMPSKSFDVRELTEPQHDADTDDMTVTLGANQGSDPRSTLSPNRVVIEDQADSEDFWDVFELTGLGTVTRPSGADRVQVDLYDGTRWVTGTPAATAALPAGVDLADVQGIRFTFSRADGGLLSDSLPAQNWSARALFTVNLRDTHRSTGEPVEMTGEVTNTQSSWTTRTDGNDSEVKKATARVRLTKGTRELAVNKLTNDGERVAAVGSAVKFDLTVHNSGTGYLTLTDLVDELPAELLYTGDPAPVFTADADGELSEDVTVTPADDERSVRFSWPADGNRMKPGETFRITLYLELQPGLTSGQHATNAITASTEEELASCSNTETKQKTTDAWASDPHTCGAEDFVSTYNGPNLYTVKGVAGSLEGAYHPTSDTAACTPNLRVGGERYYRAPCIAHSQVGGTDDWVLHNVNAGTVPLAQLTVFDQLPVVGDRLLVSGDGRGSTFRPELVAESLGVAAPDGTTTIVEVTTSPDVCVGTWSAGASAEPCAQNGETWQPAGDGTDWSGVTGLRVRLDFTSTTSGGLQPGEAVDVTFSTRNTLENADDPSGASRDVPVADELAWNQYGVTMRYQGDTAWGRIAPNKVGVHLRTGSIRVDKQITGPASEYASDRIDVEVVCRVGDGDDAELLDLGTSAVLELDEDGDWSQRIVGIPVSEQGTSCTVTEQGEVGAFGETSRTGSPTTVAVTYADDVAGTPGDVPATQVVSLTNDYRFSGLSLTKRVDTDAQDVDLGPFTFTLTCVAGNGTTVTFDDDGTTELQFQLRADETFDAPADRIPANAECVVTETDADFADRLVFTGDNVTDLGDGSATVTPGSTPAAVEVTNAYDAGTVTLTKQVDGDGAALYGTGEFVFDVVCTYRDQTPFDGQVTLRAGESRTFGPYPIGTECAAAETRSASATTTAMDPVDGVATVPDANDEGVVEGVTITATNTFDLTALDVTKQVRGATHLKAARGPFEVRLECTWLVDGERVSFDVPGGATRTLETANDYHAVFADLPSSAACELTETRTGGADATSITAQLADGTVEADGTHVALDLTGTGTDTPATAEVTNTFVDHSALPDSGSSAQAWVLALGLALLACGAGAVAVGRRREV